MISVRQNIARRCTCIIGYVLNETGHYLKQNKITLSRNFYHNCFKCTDSTYNCLYEPNSIQSRKSSWSNLKCCVTSLPSTSFSTEYVPKDPDTFGELGFGQYEKYEMDEDEKKEETFTENEARVPRRLKPSAGQYAKKIKSYLDKGDLYAALNVLDLVKENRDKPTVYMYSLLIRAFAVQGDLRRCSKLHKAMKDRGMKVNAAVYTSLFNACATSKDTEKAILYLNNLRQRLYEDAFPLNAAHYHAMMKAYSRHNSIAEAFQLVDEMKDKGIYIGQHTYNSLMYSAICDKKAGLRHVLILWHMMRADKLKVNLVTYHLLLRAIRDTEFGSLKVNDILIERGNLAGTKICIAKEEKPNLLASPPAVNTLLPAVIGINNEKEKVATRTKNVSIETLNLNDILSKNRLILFGGYNGILESMDKDNVVPDIKTISLLIELVPPDVKSEQELIQCAKSRGIELDVDFYNVLIKKRSVRCHYRDAKEVLYLMQKDNISPNIMTFGVLALGCLTLESALQLLEGMESTGYVANTVILTTLISNGCRFLDIKYILEMIKYMRYNRIRPTAKTFEVLDNFQHSASNLVKQKDILVVNQGGNRKYIKRASFKDDLTQFKEKYSNWKEIIEKKEIEMLAKKEKEY